MHDYASNDRNHKSTVLYLGSFATIVSAALTMACKDYIKDLPFPVEIPGAMSVLAGLYWLFDKYLWRIRVKGRGASSIPDLRGSWVASFQTSHDERLVEHLMYVEIKQTWTQMVIRTENATSKSQSQMAALDGHESLLSGLRYEYVNTPKIPKEGLQGHAGAVQLTVQPDGKELSGTYYTGPSRTNHGDMVVRFIDKEPLRYEDAIAKFEQWRASQGASLPPTAASA